MDSKRNTMGDLDRVLQELGTFSIDIDDTPSPVSPEPLTARPRIKIPRVSIVDEVPERKSSIAEYENMSQPSKSHRE